MDIVPVVPQSFHKRLMLFDPDLKVLWNRDQAVWSIWHDNNQHGTVDHVLSVVNDDGSYRELDERVFQVLRANRYFAQNPKELEKKMVDDVADQAQRDRRSKEDDLRHMAKDKSLKKEFQKVKDTAASIPEAEFKKPVVLHDSNGNVLRNRHGQEVYFKPDESLL